LAEGSQFGKKLQNEWQQKESVCFASVFFSSSVVQKRTHREKRERERDEQVSQKLSKDEQEDNRLVDLEKELVRIFFPIQNNLSPKEKERGPKFFASPKSFV